MSEPRGVSGKNPAAIAKNHKPGIRNLIVRQKGSSEKRKRWLKRFRKSRNNPIFKFDP
jgi:hypothetical protein